MKSGLDTMPLFLLDNLLRNEKKKEIVAKMPSRSRNHSLTTSSPLHNPRLNAISKEHYDNHDHNYDWNHIQSDKIPDSNQVFPSSCYLEQQPLLLPFFDKFIGCFDQSHGSNNIFSMIFQLFFCLVLFFTLFKKLSTFKFFLKIAKL